MTRRRPRLLHLTVAATTLATVLAVPAAATTGAQDLPSVAGNHIALITGNATDLPAPDQAIADLLTANGYRVQAIDDDLIGAEADDIDQHAAAIAISSSVDISKVPSSLADSVLPILNLEGFLSDDLGLATRSGEQTVNRNSVIMNAEFSDSPLAAGLTGFQGVYPSAQPEFNFGEVGGDAMVIATTSGRPRQASYYAYEAGSTLASGDNAPARRVAHFPTYDGPSALTAKGAALFLASVEWLMEAPPTDADVTIKVLSSEPQFVSGGDALIEVTAPVELHDELEFSIDGVPIDPVMESDGTRRRGVISGLAVGENTLAVRGNGVRGSIVLTNHPISGPIFSGPQLTPFECRTVESGLGEPLDDDCFAPTTVQHFYLSTSGGYAPLVDATGPRPADVATTTLDDGRTVPFIVRVESGVINRSIYRIAVLDDPTTDGVWNDANWNERVVYTFGASTGTEYNQGVNQATSVLGNTAAQLGLGRGFAMIISTQNVNKLNPNDVLSAEGVMMIEEHFIETYGVPEWVMGYGGSGGAIQQMLIVQNYPGLLDGILPNAAFPDVVGTAQAVSDCRLLNRYFLDHPASGTVRRGFEGFTNTTCANWDAGNGDAIVADVDCGLSDESLVYDAITNPDGARCTVYDVNANSLGRDPVTGFARRPLDNVGIAYGLAALRDQTITPAQFLDLNEDIGGYDVDGKLVAERTQGDVIGIENAYRNGRVGSGAGGLATVPILNGRTWAEPGGDIHTAYNDVQIREKLLAANGRADNMVAWVLPHPQLPLVLGGTPGDVARVNAFVTEVFTEQFEVMVQWLDGIAADPAEHSIDKVVEHKPAAATDACWDLDGVRHDEALTMAADAFCNTLYPKSPSPRIVAGAPITDDILKCQLKPVSGLDTAPVVFDAAETARLEAIFPEGVCDYSLPGVGQVPLAGTWLAY